MVTTWLVSRPVNHMRDLTGTCDCRFRGLPAKPQVSWFARQWVFAPMIWFCHWHRCRSHRCVVLFVLSVRSKVESTPNSAARRWRLAKRIEYCSGLALAARVCFQFSSSVRKPSSRLDPHRVGLTRSSLAPWWLPSYSGGVL